MDHGESSFACIVVVSKLAQTKNGETYTLHSRLAVFKPLGSNVEYSDFLARVSRHYTRYSKRSPYRPVNVHFPDYFLYLNVLPEFGQMRVKDETQHKKQ